MDSLNNIKEKIKYAIMYFYYRLKHFIIKPKYPSNENGKIYIHLGCGDINSPEFINVDSRPLRHVHHVSDVKSLPIFPDNFADLIYVSHTLEHIPMEEIRKVLKEWKRILKIGGCLRISVPDFEHIINIYRSNNNSIESVWKPLLGGQEYPENIHYAIFNKSYLYSILESLGFRNICEWDPKKVEHHKFNDWASSELEISGRLFPISLNLEATK